MEIFYVVLRKQHEDCRKSKKLYLVVLLRSTVKKRETLKGNKSIKKK